MQVSHSRWRQRSRELRIEAHAIYLAMRDPRVPWYAKALAACVLGYLFSPIDLIPDFIPVIGYLDDFIVVTVGLLLVIRLIPATVMAEHLATARLATLEEKPNWVAAALILCIWVALAAMAASFLWHRIMT